MKKLLGKLDINSPVILGMAAASLLLLVASYVTGGRSNRFFALTFTSFLDPLLYVRLLTHCIAHADLAHYIGNFLLILVIGPIVEEKYGSYRLLAMIGVSAVLTAIVNIIFFRNIMLLGASGIVFMLIILASFVNIRDGKIPLTVVLVAVLYLGNEIAGGLFLRDNISQLSHIVGGLSSALFGFLLNRAAKKAE